MALRVTNEQLHLAGVPAGLVARPLRRHRAGSDGELIEVKTRSRLAKLERVELAPVVTPTDPVQLEAGEERWLLQTNERRWPAISARYGERALDRAAELARAGVVRLRCRVDERLAVSLPPLGWVLTEPWQRRCAEAKQLRGLEREHWQERALIAAGAVELLCPALAASLRASKPGGSALPVLVYAAEDLVEGVTHDGPRAFSQTHFGHTKARDDVAQVLRAAGVDDDTLVRLGVRRSGRIGVAGPVAAAIDGRPVALDLLDGPVLLRADQQGLSIRLTASAAIVIVENLQAAETLADRHPELAVIYTAGPPSDPALRLIGQLATSADRVLVITDADLGGVRIAERLLTAAPTAELVDIGVYPHPPAERWPDDGISVAGLIAALGGRAGELARACLDRGYPVEQELATIAAVADRCN